MMEFFNDAIQPVVNDMFTIVLENNGKIEMSRIMDVYTRIYTYLTSSKVSHDEIDYFSRYQQNELARFVSFLSCDRYDQIYINYKKFKLIERSFNVLFYYPNRLYNTGSDERIFLDEFLLKYNGRLLQIICDRLLYEQDVKELIMILKTFDKKFDSNIYDDFEEQLISYFVKFFDNKYESWVSLKSLEYINKVLDYKNSINNIFILNNMRDSLKRINQIITSSFVSSRKDLFKNFGQALLHNTNVEEYYRFIKLYDVGVCLEMYKDYLRGSLMRLSRDDKCLVVDEVIELYNYEEELNEKFKEAEFARIFSNQWKEFFNQNKNIIPLFVIRIDKQIKIGIKDGFILDFVIFIDDKDEFLTTYKKYFCKRLINGTNIEIEKYYVDYLGNKITRSFVFSLNAMMNEYNINVKNKTDSDVNVMIVCSSQWGIDKDPVDYILPDIISHKIMRHVERFKKEEKIMTLVNHLGSVHLNAHYPNGGQYEFIVNPIQALYLLKLGVQYCHIGILSKSVSSEEDFNCRAILSTLDSLIETKDDMYRLKKSFVSKKRKHRISFIELKKKIERSRKDEIEKFYVIDAVIVRILKLEKKMYFEELVKEIRERINNFIPDVSDIKERLSRLIDMDFVKRDEVENNLFIYT